jgi:hypothetical protein
VLKKYPIKYKETSLEYFVVSGRNKDQRFVEIKTVLKQMKKTKININKRVFLRVLITSWTSTIPEK